MNVHDALFKQTFSQPEHATGAFQRMLSPGLVARLDFATLTLCPGTFVDEIFKERQTDLLFSVTLADRPAFLYLLFEHQSRVDTLMPFRLLRYMLRIWETWQKTHPEAKRLPPILPLVLHHSDTGWTAAKTFEELLDVDSEVLPLIAAHVPRFAFLLDDISTETDQALKTRAMTALGRLVLFCLRSARTPDQLIEGIGGWVGLMREVRRAPNGAAALAMIWRYIFEVQKRYEPKELVKMLTKAVGSEESGELRSVADKLIEQGLKKGRKQGLKKGLKEGQRKVLLKQLGVRFGALPEAIKARVNAADTAQLETWAERILTAPTLDEALRDP